jgi:hypothetical protein
MASLNYIALPSKKILNYTFLSFFRRPASILAVKKKQKGLLFKPTNACPVPLHYLQQVAEK